MKYRICRFLGHRVSEWRFWAAPRACAGYLEITTCKRCGRNICREIPQ